MFSELPKILDRNFVVAFFLPAALFVLGLIGILVSFHLGAEPFTSFEKFKADGLTASTLFGLASLLVALLLLALNYEIYRFFEGYPLDSFSSLKWFQKSRFKRQTTTKISIEEKMAPFLEAGDDPPLSLQVQRANVLRTLAERWPESESEILLTAFGNTIKAFEIYPREMYGIDAISSWPRLQAVIPKDYRSLIDEAKALTDFWVNLWTICYLLFTAWLVAAFYVRELRLSWLPVTLVLLSYVASRGARSNALGWGDIVKATFDVFLPKLQSRLGLPDQEESSEAKSQWQNFSQAVIYRIPDALPNKMKKPPTVLVFQYGSNMDSAHLNSDKRLKGDARPLRAVQTKYDFELDFTVWSVANDCAAANIVAGRGMKIWGVLYEIPENLIKRETSGNRRSLDAIDEEAQLLLRNHLGLFSCGRLLATRVDQVERKKRLTADTWICFAGYLVEAFQCPHWSSLDEAAVWISRSNQLLLSTARIERRRGRPTWFNLCTPFNGSASTVFGRGG